MEELREDEHLLPNDAHVIQSTVPQQQRSQMMIPWSLVFLLVVGLVLAVVAVVLKLWANVVILGVDFISWAAFVECLIALWMALYLVLRAVGFVLRWMGKRAGAAVFLSFFFLLYIWPIHLIVFISCSYPLYVALVGSSNGDVWLARIFYSGLVWALVFTGKAVMLHSITLHFYGSLTADCLRSIAIEHHLVDFENELLLGHEDEDGPLKKWFSLYNLSHFWGGGSGGGRGDGGLVSKHATFDTFEKLVSTRMDGDGVFVTESFQTSLAARQVWNRVVASQPSPVRSLKPFLMETVQERKRIIHEIKASSTLVQVMDSIFIVLACILGGLITLEIFGVDRTLYLVPLGSAILALSFVYGSMLQGVFVCLLLLCDIY